MTSSEHSNDSIQIDTSSSLAPVVHIPGQGTIVGALDKTQKVAKILNIPFATAHTRWRKASPAEPWQGIRDGTRLGPMCPQFFLKSGSVRTTVLGIPTGSGYEVSERDCLNLNIFAPADALCLENQPRLPVICYIHGGRFRNGGNAMPAYDFTNFVKRSVEMGKGVIAVVINYRVGHLGFFASRELTEAEDERLRGLPGNCQIDECFGNWGLDDQKLGLEWIRDHIHTFGGDPLRVTAMGHSAGSTSIAHHTMLPSHRGLFQRAIFASGFAGMIPPKPAYDLGQRYFDHVCTKLGVDMEASGQQKLASLMAVSASKLNQVPIIKGLDTVTYPLRVPRPSTFFYEHTSGMAAQPERYDPGLRSVIFGQTADECSIYSGNISADSMQTWLPTLISLIAPEYHRALLKVYGEPTNDEEAVRISAQFTADLLVNFPVYLSARSLLGLNSGNLSSARGNPEQRPTHLQRTPYRRAVNRFLFRASLEAMRNDWKDVGAHHSADMAFAIMSDVFQSLMTEKEKALGFIMVSKWVDFAWGDDEVFTPRARHGQEAVVFTKDLEVRRGPFEILEEKYVAFHHAHEEFLASRPLMGSTSYKSGAEEAFLKGEQDRIVARL